jgi:GT2 family glycosyltransferase
MTDSNAGPAVSIVVVAYREREALAQCLRSSAQAGRALAGGAELIVVDNGALADFVRGLGLDVTLLEPGENLGFAGGAQLGIKSAQGRWIALVNDDARIERDSLARMLETGESDDRIGSVAAQVRFQADPRLVNSAGIEVDSLGRASERLAGRPVAEAGQRTEIFGASGCFALYRSSMLRLIDGIDGRFFAYLEDVDLAWRARAAGWRCVYEPGAIAHHRGSTSSGEGSARKYFLVGRNRVRLLARNATRGQLLRALPGIALYDGAYVLYAACSDCTLAPLRGRLAGLRQWRALRRETRGSRRAVAVSSAGRGWLSAIRMRRAYRSLAARG